MNPKKFFWELTGKLEVFTHTVPVPFAVYYAVITQKMSFDKWVIFVGLCLTFATGIGILGTVWRYFYIKRLAFRIQSIHIPEPSSNISYTYKDRDYAKKVKLELFRYPLVEAIIIVLRWFAGVIPIISIFSYSIEYMPSVIRSGVFTLLMIPPISFVTYYFITENSVRPLFDLPQIRDIELKPEEIPRFDYFQRIFLAFISLALMPVSVLSYILYSVMTGDTAVQDPLVPIVIVGFIFVLPLITCSYIVASSVKQGIADTNHFLNELVSGNFNVVVMPRSGDDFGQQAFHLNNVIRKLKEMYAEIRDLNESLEEKVVTRTEELNQTLSEVQTLKNRQDGDYYLTHLLLNPLGVWDNESSTIHLESLLKQKKEFEFKEKTYEIGGDLNIASSIFLQKKKYTILLNSDAMGKSMQGAGGALVLGAIFSSILQRAKNSELIRQQTPERWLKNSFIEMHKVFESFDGTMLVSLSLTLIEDQTGFMYYLNAEHPWLVLYRDEKASFIRSAVSYRKLGTLGVKSKIKVSTFRLQAKDVLILGSDGKDDLNLNRKELASEIKMNIDEDLFLKVVENKKANLTEIYEELRKIGDIVDDVSMIRAEFIPQSHSLNETPRADFNDLANDKEKWETAQNHFLKKEFDKAIPLAEDFFNSHPWDNAALSFLSKLYQEVGKRNKSEEAWDRLTLRGVETN